MYTLRTIVIVSLLAAVGLFSGGCSSGTFLKRDGNYRDPVLSERFERPNMSAREATKELEKRLAERVRELDTARSQIAILNAVMIDDPQLEVASDIINGRITSLEEDVRELGWKHERAVEAASLGSVEDFAMTLTGAPQLLREPTQSCESVCKELNKRFLQLEAEVDARALHINRSELDAQRLGGLSRDREKQLATDRSEKERLEEELLETGWRLEIAQVAATNRSKLDIAPLLTAPEISAGSGTASARR